MKVDVKFVQLYLNDKGRLIHEMISGKRRGWSHANSY